MISDTFYFEQEIIIGNMKSKFKTLIENKNANLKEP